jgi:hypothetical protein
MKTLSVAVQKSASLCGEPDCGLLNQSHTRIKGLLVSFDSEIRTRAYCTMKRISESGH